jgi:hypothetical protein
MVQTINQEIAGQARNDGAVLDCKPAMTMLVWAANLRRQG